MPMISEGDLQALGCKNSFASIVSENCGVLPIYGKVLELMFSMQTNDDFSPQDVFEDLLEIARYIEVEGLWPVTDAVTLPESPLPRICRTGRPGWHNFRRCGPMNDSAGQQPNMDDLYRALLSTTASDAQNASQERNMGFAVL